MAHGTLAIFSPTNLIGDLTGWTFQNGGGKNASKERASELGDDGDELMSALHNGKETATLEFVGALTTGNYSFPAVGAHANGWHIDEIQVKWDRGQIRPKMTVTVHRHTEGAMHTTCRTYVSSLSGKIAAQVFGCPSDFDDAFALTQGAVVGMRSATLTVRCSHVDEPNGTGGNLMGDNYDGVETLAVELTGAATADDYETSWDEPDSGDTPSNTGATTRSLNFEHHIAHTVQGS